MCWGTLSAADVADGEVDVSLLVVSSVAGRLSSISSGQVVLLSGRAAVATAIAEVAVATVGTAVDAAVITAAAAFAGDVVVAAVGALGLLPHGRHATNLPSLLAPEIVAAAAAADVDTVDPVPADIVAAVAVADVVDVTGLDTTRPVLGVGTPR